MVSSRHFCKFHLSSSIARSSDVFLSREKFSPPEDFSNFRKYNRILGGEKGNHLEGAISDDSELFSSLPTILAVLTYFSCPKTFQGRKIFTTFSNTNIFQSEKTAMVQNGRIQTIPNFSALYLYYSQFWYISLAPKIFTLGNFTTYSNTIIFSPEKRAIVFLSCIQTIPQVSYLYLFYSQF